MHDRTNLGESREIHKSIQFPVDTSSNLTRTPSLSLSFIVVTLLLTRNERTKQRSPLLSSIRTMPNNAEVLLLK